VGAEDGNSTARSTACRRLVPHRGSIEIEVMAQTSSNCRDETSRHRA